MFKKGFVALLLSVLLAVMVGTTAFAQEAVVTPEIAQALNEVEQVNAEIYEVIANGQAQADQLYEEYLLAVSEAGETALLKADYEQKLTQIISKVDMKTQEITRHGVEKARESGLNVEIEWIPVQFADRIALIDPIKVVGW